MNNKENEQSKIKSKMPDSETWIKLYYNVRRCKELDWEEKALLTNYLSFQMKGDEFFQTDSGQGRKLGLSTAQVSKYTSRLKERGEIETEMKYEVNPTGGRPIPVRYVKVIDVDKWTKNEAMPIVKKIISAGKKRLAKKMAEFTSTKNEAVSNADTTTGITITNNIVPANEPEAKPSIKPNKVNKEKSLEEMLEEVDTKGAEATTSTQIKSNDAGDVIILDSEKDIDSSSTIGKIIVAQIKNGKQVEFIKVKVKFNDELIEDEATLLTNGSNKYCLKTFVELIDASVFE